MVTLDRQDAALAPQADSRRRLRRELVEQVLARAEHLPPGDRTLLQTVLGDGRSARDVGAMLGVSPQVVHRRVQTLVRRVQSVTFVYVVNNAGRFPETRRRVAHACFIRGLPIRQAAGELQLSLYAVRHHAYAIRALIEDAQR